MSLEECFVVALPLLGILPARIYVHVCRAPSDASQSCLVSLVGKSRVFPLTVVLSRSVLRVYFLCPRSRDCAEFVHL